MGERQVPAHVGTMQVEDVGVGEHRGVSVRPRQRHDDHVSLADRRAVEVGVTGRVAVDARGRRLEAYGLLHGGGEQAAVCLHLGQLVGMEEQVAYEVRDHALGRVDASEQEHRGVRHHLVQRQPSRRCHDHCGMLVGGGRELHVPAQRGERLGSARTRVAQRGDVVDRRDDAVVPLAHQRGVGVAESQRLGHREHRQRAGDGRTDLGVPGPADRLDQVGRLVLDQRAEAGMCVRGAELPHERVAMVHVCRPVGGEHARTDDPRRGEPGVVDGERGRVPEHPLRQGPSGHHPRAQRVHPRHRAHRPQVVQDRVRIGLELLDGHVPTVRAV
jgi:hypothetical protein